MKQHRNAFTYQKLLFRLVVMLVLVLLAASGAAYLWRGNPSQGGTPATFTVFQGPMEIAVLEGGSIEARDSLQIQSEVQGSTKILSLIEEGYMITQEDVDNGLVLIELDSKELLDKQLAQELEYQSSLAALTDAIEQHAIQINQNESDIKVAELDVHFARMDLEKYLGESLARSILAEIGLDTPPAADAELPSRSEVWIDFTQYAHPDKLGDGEARQRLRQMEDELALAEEDVGLAATKLDGTRRLFDREFVTKTQMDNDQMAHNRKVIARQSAETSRALFIKYEFPKQAQTLLSDYEESLRRLARAQKLAHSRIAQSEARRNSAEARHALQTRKREELATQIEKCTIRAPRPGMVVYGVGDRNQRGDPIEEGATVRERQVLLTIPGTSGMAVRVQVHESFVKKVRPGQRARIRVDAYPTEMLSGTVSRISVLPDSQNRWLNPDLKVYGTTIYIDGEYEWLRPGMSAEAEIVTDVIEDAVQVPLQAIQLLEDETVCYVVSGPTTERRSVRTGEFNISYMQVLDGLMPGEQVLLRPPDAHRDVQWDEGEGQPSNGGDEAQAGEQPRRRRSEDGGAPS